LVTPHMFDGQIPWKKQINSRRSFPNAAKKLTQGFQLTVGLLDLPARGRGHLSYLKHVLYILYIYYIYTMYGW
jgi:hypothetical protein